MIDQTLIIVIVHIQHKVDAAEMMNHFLFAHLARESALKRHWMRDLWLGDWLGLASCSRHSNSTARESFLHLAIALRAQLSVHLQGKKER